MSLCALLAGMNRFVLVYGAPATALRLCAESRQLFHTKNGIHIPGLGYCLLMQKRKFSFLALDRREGEMGKVSGLKEGGKGIKILNMVFIDYLIFCEYNKTKNRYSCIYIQPYTAIT